VAADPEIVKELGGTDLFGKVRRKSLEAIASQARVVQHAPGKEITEEGGSATGFHLIRSGAATVDVGGSARPNLGPGDYFGEISLIDGQPRSATVTAEGPLTTISLASWSFKPILDEEPDVARALLVVLCQRLRAAEHR
jgi:CRP/FNR family transcriptional regulator, cyclic AMP receptor protein